MGIRRVLIANRGEIAVRIVRACRALGIESVAAVSEADREALAAKMADRSICIGPPSPSASYLNAGAIIAAALGTGSDAVHPGYGFLAEDPGLAQACAENGLRFIGPRPESLREMGNKIEARAMVQQFGIPVVPGSKKVASLREVSAVVSEMGFPVLLKAAAGGGGRGIKRVSKKGELETAFATAAAEARAAFGDETLYVERYIADARHVEVQILGDRFGNVVHVGDRDCSIQRRYQKVVEEAPAPNLSVSFREELHRAAVTVGTGMGYENAGTVEFIVDQEAGKFYFLEMNTRIQVEHTVTEMVTGMDLVQQQIRIAGGERLGFSQEEIRFTGHAVECRITAESPKSGFRPCPGKISQWRPPRGSGIRVDSHCFPGYAVPPYYDSLLAKLVLCGENRVMAISKAQRALESFVVSGLETTIPFLHALVCQLDFLRGKVNTRWLEERMDRILP